MYRIHAKNINGLADISCLVTGHPLAIINTNRMNKALIDK